MLNVFRPSFEVVEEGRNMNKFKYLQRQNVWYQVLDRFILFLGDLGQLKINGRQLKNLFDYDFTLE